MSARHHAQPYPFYETSPERECGECAVPWPCDVARLLAEIERLRLALETIYTQHGKNAWAIAADTLNGQH